MRDPHNIRTISMAEILLISQVFRSTQAPYPSNLPSWDKIKITDGLGPIPTVDNPYTERVPGVGYFINVGPEVYPDATLKKYFNGFGTYDAILVHEMVHVWQYSQGYAVGAHSLWACTAGAGYDYDTTKWQEWDDYNVEQQAHIVEDWYRNGKKSREIEGEFGLEYGDPRFYYVKKFIRGEQVDLDLLVKTVHPLPRGTLHVEVHSSLEYLVPIFQQRFGANDVAGYGARVRKLEDIFNRMEAADARDLRLRLDARRPGDKVAQYFFANLSAATRLKLLGILKNRYPYAS